MPETFPITLDRRTAIVRDMLLVCLLVLIAYTLREMPASLLGTEMPTFVLFCGAVVGASWFGGFRSGAAAIILSMVVIALSWTFSAEASHEPPINGGAKLVVFGVVGLISISIIQRLQQATRESESARQEAVQTREQVAFQQRVATALSTSTNLPTLVSTIGYLAVTHFADWCIVDLAGGRRFVTTLDPSRQRLADDLAAYPLRRDSDHVIGRALRTASTIGPEYAVRSMLDGRETDPESNLVRTLGCRAVVTTPLIADGVTLGAITFVRTHNPTFARNDLSAMTEFAWRASLPLRNHTLNQHATEPHRNATD